MPLTKNLGAYADVEDVLRTAFQNEGGVYTLSSEKDAIRWRQRAYYYRTLLYERDGHTLYDRMKLRLEAESVIIEFETVLPGNLTSLEGKPLEVVDEVTEMDELAKGLGGVLDLD